MQAGRPHHNILRAGQSPGKEGDPQPLFALKGRNKKDCSIMRSLSLAPIILDSSDKIYFECLGASALRIYYSLNAVLQDRHVKVDQKAERFTGGLEIGEDLSGMKRQELFHRFDFYY